jgi:hypothetical protein
MVSDIIVSWTVWRFSGTAATLLLLSGFGGLGVSALASGTQVRGLKPGRRHRIFQGEKNPQRAFLRKGSKTVDPMSLIYGM